MKKGKYSSFKIVSLLLDWHIIRLENITVKNGNVEIGFKAGGAANSFCYVDDITLLRVK